MRFQRPDPNPANELHKENAMDELEQLPIPLLVWYRENARVLPWRTHPTPYREIGRAHV